MKYKTGEVSKILGIPPDTIRFYETKSLIRPLKDEHNNYRYYDIWDINRLLIYRKFRDLGFSSNDSVDIIKFVDIAALTERLEEKIQDAEQNTNFYYLKMLKLQSYRNILKSMPLLLDEYVIADMPEGYYFINQWYIDGTVHCSRAEEYGDCFQEMMKLYLCEEYLRDTKRMA